MHTFKSDQKGVIVFTKREKQDAEKELDLTKLI